MAQVEWALGSFNNDTCGASLLWDNASPFPIQTLHVWNTAAAGVLTVEVTSRADGTDISIPAEDGGNPITVVWNTQPEDKDWTSLGLQMQPFHSPRGGDGFALPVNIGLVWESNP